MVCWWCLCLWSLKLEIVPMFSLVLCLWLFWRHVNRVLSDFCCYCFCNCEQGKRWGMRAKLRLNLSSTLTLFCIIALTAFESAVYGCVKWVTDDCICTKWWSYQIDLLKVASSGLTFLWFLAFLLLYTLPEMGFKVLREVFWWFNGVFLGSIPVPVEKVFYWRSESDVLHYEIDYVLALVCDWATGNSTYVDTSVVGFACSPVRIWHGRKKVVDVDIARVWDTQLIDTVLGISFQSMVTVCNWTLITWKLNNATK